MKFIPGDGTTFYTKTTFDMAPNIESAAALRSNGAVHGALGKDAWHVARIDKRLLDKLVKEAGLKWSDKDAVRDLIDKKLHDGTLGKLRVHEGSFR